VRFADGRTVWRAVERSVREALAAGTRAAPRAATAGVAEAVETYVARHIEFPQQERFEAARSARDVPSSSGTRSGLSFEAEPPSVLGQHRNTYIVASDGEDLLLFDQHTAHERVRFEAVLERLERRTAESQILLAPLVIALAPELQPVLEAHQSELGAVGFDVEGFGGGSVRLRALPALLGARDPGRALEALLRDLLERESTEWVVSGARDRLAATLACHSAVRAGQPLSRELMSAIVKDLAATAHPTLCPHGRPTQVRVPRADVTRWFERTGWRRQ
jgi:DNA mismatch repair protein MutL